MGVIRRVLPDSQRRSLSELTEDLDLTEGDSASKRSAFWAMLTLSAVIATAGVLSDSTATVIGAMIIAPLSTPIMGIALGIAKQEPGGAARAGRFVLGGATLVVAIGVLFAFVIPDTFDLLGNSQISGRTSPGLGDLVAAVATGFAGAIALARRDVAAVLPGVAIAISLVPPLAGVGVCLPARPTGGARRRAYLTITILFIVVGIPLLMNTIGNLLVSVLESRAQAAAEQWISGTTGGQIQSVDFVGNELHIQVQVPAALPATDTLLTTLSDDLPRGIPVVVNSSQGSSVKAGQTQ